MTRAECLLYPTINTIQHDKQSQHTLGWSRRYVHLRSAQIWSLNFTDIPEILAMIKELAGFEKADDRVEATEESLASTLSFAPDFKGGYAKTFLITVPALPSTAGQSAASSEERVAGMALYFHNYSTWLATPGIYLEDLFIRPRFRRGGFATLLLKRLAEETAKVSGGRGRLEWSCLKWNVNALDFYEKIGAEQMEEWVGLRVEGQGLRKLAYVDVL